MRTDCKIAYVCLFVASTFWTFAAQAQTWNFTTCGATGRFGPSQGDCNTAYLGTSLEGDVAVSGGVQVWSAPVPGIYRITAAGAAGGDSLNGTNGSFTGGLGAQVSGEFTLAADEDLNIIVGQVGDTPVPASKGETPDVLGGGGGGSFTWKSAGNELVIAGGAGGGAGDGFSGTGADGADGTAGTSGSISVDSEDCTTLATPGEGWRDSDYSCGNFYSGGGAGWNSDGAVNADTCSTTPTDAQRPLNGGLGGAGNEDDDETGPGGFGGGGGSGVQCGSTGGGGGGGYTGGGGTGCAGGGGCGDGGGGGGSFNAGANPEGTTGIRSGDGLVTIELIQSFGVIPTLSPGALVLLSFLMGAVALVVLRRQRGRSAQSG